MNICIPNKRLDMNFLNFAFCTYFSNGELKPFGCTKSLCVRYKVVLIKNKHCWFHPVRFKSGGTVTSSFHQVVVLLF